MTFNIRRLLLCVSLTHAYLLSLYLPVFQEHQIWYGYNLLLTGWMGIAMLQLGWFANPLFLVLLIAMTFSAHLSVKWSRFAAVSLGLCAIESTLFQEVFNDMGGSPITAHYAGYYLWLACMAVMVGWVFLRTRRSASVSLDT